MKILLRFLTAVCLISGTNILALEANLSATAVLDAEPAQTRSTSAQFISALKASFQIPQFVQALNVSGINTSQGPLPVFVGELPIMQKEPGSDLYNFERDPQVLDPVVEALRTNNPGWPEDWGMNDEGTDSSGTEESRLASPFRRARLLMEAISRVRSEGFERIAGVQKAVIDLIEKIDSGTDDTAALSREWTSTRQAIRAAQDARGLFTSAEMRPVAAADALLTLENARASSEHVAGELREAVQQRETEIGQLRFGHEATVQRLTEELGRIEEQSRRDQALAKFAEELPEKLANFDPDGHQWEEPGTEPGSKRWAVPDESAPVASEDLGGYFHQRLEFMRFLQTNQRFLGASALLGDRLLRFLQILESRGGMEPAAIEAYRHRIQEQIQLAEADPGTKASEWSDPGFSNALRRFRNQASGSTKGPMPSADDAILLLQSYREGAEQLKVSWNRSTVREVLFLRAYMIAFLKRGSPRHGYPSRHELLAFLDHICSTLDSLIAKGFFLGCGSVFSILYGSYLVSSILHYKLKIFQAAALIAVFGIGTMVSGYFWLKTDLRLRRVKDALQAAHQEIIPNN